MNNTNNNINNNNINKINILIDNINKQQDNIFSLYFNTQYQSKNKLNFIIRLGTQLFSKSNYEHIANVIMCPENYDNQEYTDNVKTIKVKKGYYYVFEATHNNGIIITELKERLLNPVFNCNDWTGEIHIQQKCKQTIEREFLEIAWKDATSMLKTPYSTTSAFFSAFDNINIFKTIRNIFDKKSYVNYTFCSMFSIINWAKYFYITIDKQIARNFTPDEVSKYLIEKKLCNIPNILLIYEKGKILDINKDFKF